MSMSLLDWSRKVIGTQQNTYWTDWIPASEPARTIAINRMIDMMHDAGFNHVRASIIGDDAANDIITKECNRAHALGMTFSGQTLRRTWSTIMSDLEQDLRAILNVNNEGVTWRRYLVQNAVHYNLDAINLMNEPMAWSWYEKNAGAWFDSYRGTETEASFAQKYHNWVVATIAALRAAKSGIMCLVDTMPFYNTTIWAANGWILSDVDIAYSCHAYFGLRLAFGQGFADSEQWEKYYAAGNVTSGKTALDANWDSFLHGPILNAGGRTWMEECGADWVDTDPSTGGLPTATQYDGLYHYWKEAIAGMIQYNITRRQNYGGRNRYNIFDFVAIEHPSNGTLRDPLGMLIGIPINTTALNIYGKYVSNYIKTYDPLAPSNQVDFDFSKAYQQGTIKLILTKTALLRTFFKSLLNQKLGRCKLI